MRPVIEVELWDDIGGDPREAIVYRWLWTLRVDGTYFELLGDAGSFAPDMRIVNLYEAPDFLGRFPKSLTFWDNPEMWARTLSAAYRSGYTVAYTVHDDDPLPAEDDSDVEDDDPIDLPPPSEQQLEALYAAQDADILDGTGSAEAQSLLLDPVVAYFSCEELVERAREATVLERAAASVVLSGYSAHLSKGHGLLVARPWLER